jgi:regulatory protein
MNSLYDYLITSSFRILSIRQRSEKEIRDYLIKKSQKFSSDSDDESKKDAMKQVIERLKEMNYINDQQFAESWMISRSKTKQKGNIIVKNELRNKGISDDIIQSILTDDTLGDEKERIYKLIEKKQRIWGKLPKRELKMKLYQYIVRRGFSSSLVLRIIDEALQKDYNNTYDSI